MADSNLKIFALLGLLSASQAPAAAALQQPQQPILFDAQSSEFDLKNNNAIFRKVHIAQGTTTISADQGHTTKGTGISFDDSLWVFKGNVRITVHDGELTADDAEIRFSNKALAKAVVNGKPAAFEQRVQKSGRVAHGHADTIDYDAGTGVVHLTKNAWLSDGQTEIRNDSLKYDVVAQVIKSEGTEPGAQRVHIVIAPPPSQPQPPHP
jgi:lipopolysaccharide transport protein LptA